MFGLRLKIPCEYIRRFKGGLLHGVLMAWRTSKRWLNHLEQSGELLRITRPVDVRFEAGAIADLLVKNDGPAVLFNRLGTVQSAKSHWP